MKNLRKIIPFFCTVMILLSLTAINVYAAEEDGIFATVVVSRDSYLNLRNAPSQDSQVLAHLTNGTNVQVISYNKESDWYLVKYQSVYGYVLGNFITCTENLESLTSSYCQGFANVNSYLRLRENSNTSSAELAQIQKCEIFDILGEENGFYKVNFNGQIGYVASNYVCISSYPNLKMISAFKTVSSSKENRDFNMAKASGIINGMILNPTDEFNWFNVVGSCSEAKGYKEAYVIVNGEYVMGYGGGVCQISTTLYNAIYKLGITPSEHHHHSIPSSYVEKGMDATVSYPNCNFRFTNTTGKPLVIEMYTNLGEAYCVIYEVTE